MAPSRNCYLLATMIAAALIPGLAPLLAWGQSADGPETWSYKLRGAWCEAEQGCTHWWTHYDVDVDQKDNIRIWYRDDRRSARHFVIFRGKIQEPAGKWMIKGNKLDEKGNKTEEVFEAVVSEIEGLKEVIHGKIKMALEAEIQDIKIIDGIIKLQKTDGGIEISKAEIIDPKIADPRIAAPKIIDPKIKGLKVTGPDRSGATNVTAAEVDAKSIGAKNIEAKKIEATKINAKEIKGGRQIKISVPLEISEATIEGSTKLKKSRRGEDDDDERNKRKYEIKGRIKGRVALPAGGTSDWAGDFDGEFTALVQAAIEGIYVVIPAGCSEAGRPLSEEEKADLKERRNDVARNEERELGYRAKTPGRYRSPIEVGEKDKRKEEIDIEISRKREDDKRNFPTFRPKDLDKLIEGFLKSRSLIAYAEKTRSPRPAEPHTQGKFMRKVKGAVSAIEPATITLDLPALPVLDYKCSVIDETPKRTLKLVKQHDATR